MDLVWRCTTSDKEETMSYVRRDTDSCSLPARAGLLAMVVVLAGTAVAPAAAPPADSELLARGERLVRLMDCSACHTPKILTPEGPRPDPARLLSGHPADEKLPPFPQGVVGPTAWGGVFNNNLTAWLGPWGVSFADNLTPDEETGIGAWTEEDFAEAMRGGGYLPPMPAYPDLTDEELHAMFAYLRSIPAVRNPVSRAMPPVPGE